MPKKRTVKKLPRFNQFSIGKAALLFGYGLNSHEVADWMYERYGKHWKIDSPKKMHEYLFTVQRGRRPNPERMFAGKTRAEIKIIYKEWLKKARNHSSRMRKLNADPEFARKQAERMRKLHADPEFARKQAEGMRKLHADPEFVRKQAERMRKLNADPEFARKQAERMRKLNANPEFVERLKKSTAERMKKLWQNPEWRKIQRELISTALARRWNTIRAGLRKEFRIRGLLRDVEFEEDERGRSKPTSILVSTQTPAREAEQTERRQVILSALNALKSLEREAVSAIFFEGKTPQETAALFGMDTLAFEALLKTAYQKMAPKVKHLL